MALTYKISDEQFNEIVNLINEDREIENPNVHKINSQVTVYDDIETFKAENPELYAMYFSDEE
jgi:hypothetical protein